MRSRHTPRPICLIVFSVLFVALFTDGYGISSQVDDPAAQDQDRVKYELFRDLEDMFQKARSLRIPLLSPNHYQTATESYEKALSAYQKGERLQKIQESIAEAQRHLEEGFEAAKIAEIVLEEVLRTRQQAVDLKIQAQAPREFVDAESKFRTAAEQIEDGNLRRAKSSAEQADEAYLRAALEALEKGVLENARTQLKETRDFIRREDYRTADRNLDLIGRSLKAYDRADLSIDELWGTVTKKIDDTMHVPWDQVKQILPDNLLMGGFRLEVIEYTQVTNSRLSGRATGYFLTTPCSGQSSQSFTPLNPLMGPVIYSQTNFIVEFKDLETQNWPPQKTEKVNKGKIIQPLSPSTHLLVEDFDVEIRSLTIDPDSSRADVVLGLPPKSITEAHRCQKAQIGPISVAIDTLCEIQASLPGYRADSLVIGNTGVWIEVQGVQVDFKKSPKKIVFAKGRTLPQKSRVSNSGYLSADYVFSNAELVCCEGLRARFSLQKSCDFFTLVPAGFHVHVDNGELDIEKSWIKKGRFDGLLTLPEPVKNSDKNPVVVDFKAAQVDSLLNFSGIVDFNRNHRIHWGNYSVSTRSGSVFFPGTFEPYSLSLLDTLSTDTYKIFDENKIRQVLKTTPGLSFDMLHPGLQDTFIVRTPDCKNPLVFSMLTTQLIGWLSIETKGVTGELQSREAIKLMDVKLGIPENADNKSKNPFEATFTHNQDSLLWVNFKFVRNAVFDSYLGGYLDIPYPCDFTAKYKNMMATSTAELVGGDVFFEEKELKYWGVKMTADSSGNVLSVDTGQIIYMNSVIKEDVHFSKSFPILWGEMLADGGLGRFLFDYNCAGQTFDGFPFTLHAASLSKYNPRKSSTADTLGFLRAYGDVHFDFFGAKRMDIHDYKYQGKDPKKIYKTRFVTLDQKYSTTHFDKNWGNGTASLVFDVDYDNDLDSGDQNGFQGIAHKMDVGIDLKLSSGLKVQNLIPMQIDLNSLTSYVFFCKAGNIDLLSSDADLQSISGIIQIKGDAIKRIVLEGQAYMKNWDFESNTLSTIDITPSNTTLYYRGQLTFDSYGVGLLGMVSTRFVVDRTLNSLDGDISGVFQVYGGGTNIAELYQSSNYFNVEARGRLNFYVSPTTNYVQGYAKVKVKWNKTGIECEGAFFAGYAAPTDKIWALDKITRGPSIRGILKGMNTTTLTGFYFAGLFGYDVDFYVISGGIRLWAGLGFFQEGLTVTFIGHGGVELHGELLGGVLSASAWAEVLAGTKTGAIPFTNDFHMCLQGTLGIKGCAAVIFCISYETDFHVDDETGFGTGGCYAQ